MDLATLLPELRNHWLLTLFALSIFYLFGSAIYSLYFSPLAKYPGPFLAKISGWVNYYYARTGNRHIWIWQCHQIYGDTFRFQPNGILVNSVAGHRSIYNNRANVKKGKFYDFWPANERMIHTLSATDKKVQVRKRRILNSAFSDRALRSSEAFVIKHVDRFCELLPDGDGQEWSKPKNISDWNEYLVFDILSHLCWGKSFEIKEPGENRLRMIPHAINEGMKFLYPIQQSPILNTWVWLKPRGLDYIFAMILPREMKLFEEFMAEVVEKRIELEKEHDKEASEGKVVQRDMFHYLLRAKDSETGLPGYSYDEILAECYLLTTAGSDTTAITLSAFWFYVLRNNSIYTKVTNEIRSTFKSVDEICGGMTLHSCQYLEACIDESLRIAPAGSSEGPRVVLPGGLEIDGQSIPAGVTIGSAFWALFHKEEYYPDAFVYRPERWIVDEKTHVTAEDVAQAKAPFTPFSAGPDNCAGKNLAMLEMKITIARMLYRMDVRLAPGDTTGEGAPELGWGRRQRSVYQLRDAYISQRDGPIIQFKTRVE